MMRSIYMFAALLPWVSGIFADEAMLPDLEQMMMTVVTEVHQEQVSFIICS